MTNNIIYRITYTFITYTAVFESETKRRITFILALNVPYLTLFDKSHAENRRVFNTRPRFLQYWSGNLFLSFVQTVYDTSFETTYTFFEGRSCDYHCFWFSRSCINCAPL